MVNSIKYLFQALFYLAFCAVVYVFSVWPTYHYLQPDQGEIKMSLKHAGQPVEPCRQRTPEELKKLPPNMRRATLCSRERSPLELELRLDGKIIAQHSYPPGGLSRDNTVFIYKKFPVPAGEHLLQVRMKDSVREKEANIIGEKQVKLAPGQALVVGFDGIDKKFTFH